MSVPRRLAFALALLATLCSTARAQQSSIVPASHAVYDWLWTQRVFGRLPAYQMEIRPTSRDVILGHLRTLAKDSATMSATDRGLLRDFLKEFDFDQLLKNGLFKSIKADDIVESVIDAYKDRKDPYLFASRAADSSFSGAFWFSGGGGNAYDNVVGKQSYYLNYSRWAWRGFVNSSMGLGASVELDKYAATNGSSLSLLGLAPNLAADANSSVSQGTVHVFANEAWVSFARRYFTVDFGTGAAAYGPAVTDALVLRADGPPITQLRTQVGTAKLSYLFSVGALPPPALATRDSIVLADGHTIVSMPRVQRWVMMQRLTWNPSPKLTISGNEMLVYSGRGLDLKYLVPVLPTLGVLNQENLGDTDNGFVGADIIYRPLAGTELFASLLIDDIYGGSLSRLLRVGRSDSTLKTALSLGLEQRLPLDVRLGLGFIHTDPWAYAHWDQLNSWQVNGVPLGPAIGPNSDEQSIRLTRWFPLRTRVMIGIRRIRNGLNQVDSTGKVIKDVGGDLLAGTDSFGAFMQGADVQAYNFFEFELETEPIRGLKVSWMRSAQHVYQGTRIPSHTGTMFFKITYGF